MRSLQRYNHQQNLHNNVGRTKKMVRRACARYIMNGNWNCCNDISTENIRKMHTQENDDEKCELRFKMPMPTGHIWLDVKNQEGEKMNKPKLSAEAQKEYDDRVRMRSDEKAKTKTQLSQNLCDAFA